MAGIIIQSDLISGSNADILASTRLQNAPSNGVMTFEAQSSDAAAANKYTITVQLPSGDTPMEAVLVPGNSVTAGLPGVLKDDEKIMASFPVQQGGHVVFGAVETGDTEMIWRVTFTPA